METFIIQTETSQFLGKSGNIVSNRTEAEEFTKEQAFFIRAKELKAGRLVIIRNF